jgi:hypothetical protein
LPKIIYCNKHILSTTLLAVGKCTQNYFLNWIKTQQSLHLYFNDNNNIQEALEIGWNEIKMFYLMPFLCVYLDSRLNL